jgi:hypothetical protein
MAIGRISGPLLKSNLIRDGVNLAFETNLLYLDVNNARIGINTATPQYQLDVVGTARTTNLEVLNQLDIGNFTLTGNTISSNLPTISFIASGGEATAYHSRLTVNDIEIHGNKISTTVSNSNLELDPSGTGKVDIQSATDIAGNLAVNGNISATGNITIGGNLIIGDALSDTITINASIRSDLIPETNNSYDLGSAGYKWQAVYAQGVFADSLSLSSFDIGNIRLENNSITTTSSSDLVLDPSGSGAVVIGNFRVRDNTITNFVSGSITEITQTGTGYLKIAGTNAFVVPRGTTGERPTAYAVEGMTRYNIDSKALEIWDGLQWSSPAGTIGAVSESTANDIAIRFALTLG